MPVRAPLLVGAPVDGRGTCASASVSSISSISSISSVSAQPAQRRTDIVAHGPWRNRRNSTTAMHQQ